MTCTTFVLDLNLTLMLLARDTIAQDSWCIREVSYARRKTAEERTVTDVHCANANPMRGETGRQISAWGLTVQYQTRAQTQSGAAAFSSVLSVTNLLCGSTETTLGPPT